MLEVTNITKSFGKAPVLRGVSLRLEQGRAVALLGSNGSGKSVTARAVALLEPPDGGGWMEQPDTPGVGPLRYSFPLRDSLPRSTWPGVTMVFQGLHLWPHLTLRENIDLAARAVGCEFDQATAQLAGRFGLDRVMSLHPGKCSGGQRQKCAILRAYVQRRSIRYLVADEITSALDLESAELTANVLLELKTQYRIGMLLISHQLGMIARLADRVAFMEDGRIIEEGDRQLMAHPTHPNMRRYLQLLGWVE